MFMELLSILLYGIGDLWTTRIIIRNPRGDERNPLMKTILKKTDFNGMVIFKIIIMLTVFLFFYTMLWVLVVIGSATVIWNISQIASHDRIAEQKPEQREVT